MKFIKKLMYIILVLLALGCAFVLVCSFNPDITKKVAKMRFIYHTNMLDICNVLNQLGILKDEKAEIVMKDHCMKSFDCMERMGLDVRGYFNKHKNETES